MTILLKLRDWLMLPVKWLPYPVYLWWHNSIEFIFDWHILQWTGEYKKEMCISVQGESSDTELYWNECLLLDVLDPTENNKMSAFAGVLDDTDKEWHVREMVVKA